MKSTNFSVLLQKFFVDRLMRQKEVSPHTISSYRDTFRLFLQFAKVQLHKSPSAVSFNEVDAPLITSFLDNMETKRKISARSRNLRLTAIRSFFQFAAYEEPGHASQIQRVLAIPGKRYSKAIVTSLNRSEVDALLAAPDRATWRGRRDHTLILLAVQTGLRLSELTNLRPQDFHFGVGAHVRCTGKGRKERCTPLTKQAADAAKSQIKESANQSEWLFATSGGGKLSGDAVRDLLTKYQRIACNHCPSLKEKRATPHVLRHTFAMELLKAGIDRAVIALWLGHESTETTQVYFDADLTLKEKILSKMEPRLGTWRPFKPEDPLLAFLKNL